MTRWLLVGLGALFGVVVVGVVAAGVNYAARLLAAADGPGAEAGLFGLIVGGGLAGLVLLVAALTAMVRWLDT